MHALMLMVLEDIGARLFQTMMASVNKAGGIVDLIS